MLWFGCFYGCFLVIEAHYYTEEDASELRFCVSNRE